MLEKIMKFCLKHSIAVMIISLIIAFAGVYSYTKIPIDAFPDVTNKQVEVIANADGLSAMEIERTVTYPIELAMKGLPKVKQVRSVTKYGISIVTIIFDDDIDIYFARQLVFERLSEAKESVPEDAEISLSPLATVMGEIYQYTLECELPQAPDKKIDMLTELRTLQEWVIAPVLKNVPGVSEINSFGGYFKEYQVLTDPEKLLKYKLSINDIYEAVGNNNQNVGGNILEKGDEKSIIRGLGLIQNTRDIENIVLRTHEGTPVFVRDIAQVKIGQAVRQGAAIIDGKDETAGGIVMMLRGENSREVVRKVKEKVNEINNSSLLPQGIKLKAYYDRTTIVEASVGTVTRALAEGSIIVIIVLYLLLRSFRGSLIVLLSLPFSILITFIVMKVFGIESNLMTFGGLAISIGMIVDATIIQVENVQRHLSEKGIDRPKAEVVIKSVLEVRKPSILGELIIAITFLPILFLGGIEGKMFTPLAMVVAIALIASMLISIFVIPVLCFKIIKPEPEKESIIVKMIKKIYIPVLNRAMNARIVLICVLLLLLIGAGVVIPRLGTEFIPIMDEGAFDMDVSLLPSVSLEKAKEINLLVSSELKRFPELGTLVGRIGQTGLALDVRGVDKTGYVGIMEPKSKWPKKISREELIERMRQALEKIPGIMFGFSQPIQCRIDEVVAGTKAQLIIKLFGNDTEVLKEKGDEIAKVVSAIQGIKDLSVEKIGGQSYMTIDIDRVKIARYGININDIQNVIKVAVGGKTATQVYEDNKIFNVIIRFPEHKRDSLETIGNLLISSPAGYNVPLSELASIQDIEGPLQISREDGQRRIGLEMNISGRDIGSFVSEAKEKIKNSVKFPTGYYLSWGGQFENQQNAMKRLMIIAPLALGLIMALLYMTFGSIKLALLIFLNLPFAMVGGIFALYFSNLYLSVPASVGFIVLLGVAVLNGMVLVSYIAQLRESGMDLESSIKKACEDRLRPVLITAAIAIFSLIPMLIATGTGSEIQKPLATVVIGGLFTSTLLTLLVIPSFYEWFE